MIVEIAPDLSDDRVTALEAEVSAHPDVVAWNITIGTRRFILISGDESLVPDVTGTGGVVGQHATDRGYWLVDRANGVLPSAVRIGNATVGGGPFWCAAGPCALESLDDAIQIGTTVAQQGADAFRVGVFKPRTSPYNFQGKGRAGVAMLAEVRQAIGLPIVTEVLDPRDVELVADAAECLQVGTRNMTNQALLKELGNARRPVLLKRGVRTPVEEWLRAAEFIAGNGNAEVILCARGIASFDNSLRSMPDFGAILQVRRLTSLPIVFDPSHTSGRRDAVARVALAAAVFGADGLLVEAHHTPDRMYTPGDGPQAFDPSQLSALVDACRAVGATAANFDDLSGNR